MAPDLGSPIPSAPLSSPNRRTMKVEMPHQYPCLTLPWISRYPSLHCGIAGFKEKHTCFPNGSIIFNPSPRCSRASAAGAGVLELLAHPAPGKPVEMRLRDGSRFKIRSLMDLWVLKETCLDRDYEKGLPPPGEDWVILDIGAGLGDFAIRMAWQHPHTDHRCI